MQITAGKLIAYPVAILTILIGLGSLPKSVVGGFLLILAGIIALPVFRTKLKGARDVELSRWATVVIFVALFAVGLSLIQPSSTGFEGETVTKEPVEIVPSVDEFSETGWSGWSKEIPVSEVDFTNEADSAAKGTYYKGTTLLTITVLKYSSVKKAETNYEQIIEEEMGGHSTTEHNIGDESRLATLVIGGSEYTNLIFREENVVCRVTYGGVAFWAESGAKKYGRKVIENLG